MTEWAPAAETPPGGFVPVGTPRVVPGGWIQVPPDATAPQPPPPPAPPPPDAAKRTGWAYVWHVILGLDLTFMTLLVILNVVAWLFLSSTLDEATQGTPDKGQMWLESLISLVMFGLIPLGWVLGTRVRPIEGTKRYLHLHRFWPSVGHGFGYAALLLGIIMLLLLALQALGVDMGGGAAEERFLGLDWPLVFGISFIAGFGEEVFFRGVLQKWTGVWGQAIIFGLFHIPGGLVSFFVTAGIGLLFGYLVKHGRSLWLVITAHFVYDLFLLSFTLLAQEAPTEPALGLLGRWV